MRDVLIHAYFGVNIERVWVVIKKDLPHLEKEITAIMAELESSAKSKK